MGYWTIFDGESDQGSYGKFDEALSGALDIALTMAADRNIDEESIDTFENGDRSDPSSHSWEAGACPEGDNGAYWPHVKWRND